MRLASKLLDNLYLPSAVVILILFLVVNGWLAWPKAVYLGAGLVIGWFLISVYLSLIKVPQLALVFHSVIFQIGFLLFSFWLVTSSESLFASGLILGINLLFVKELLFDYQKRRSILKKRLFNNLEISDHLLLAYVVGFALLVALLAVLVIL